MGAVGGVLAVKELIPPAYKHLLRGPRLMVDLNRGALAEFVLTFTITFSILFAVLKGPRSPVLKTWIIVLATYVVIILGAGFTGPSLNPAHVRTTLSLYKKVHVLCIYKCVCVWYTYVCPTHTCSCMYICAIYYMCMYACVIVYIHTYAHICVYVSTYLSLC